ncbi:PadR family transcriptional regulator [Paenibacillus doosanensis]|uniref:Transcriptional regulator PadR-like family protein n=1 Tax=Paenibacillus konkukensis TaxID=2020716 RepID=A0ABY4RYR4_9BACL|nr:MULTISPECIES: PadR family transcriptional regulator [Paenibacillus]MCS7458950.1 PadR family transcriptional regulator [Paenibacillus doosanensis]UQZ86519.1 Transcriptional regulator PadR-like family protein [Paenibacillus konkukensis]
MSMKLVILGLLMEGDSHPYEIRQMMKVRELHHYIKIQDGSLYYAIDQLRKDECIEAVEVVKDSNRPDKTIYRITGKGKELFQELLLCQLEERKQIYDPMATALVFAQYGDQDEIYAILAKKVEEQQTKVQQMRDIYEEHIPKVPRGVLHLMMSAYEHGLTQLRSLERLAQDAKEGRLRERGTPIDE